ncbi:hypothetical protein Dsin_027895 [Dipteronia sinensis]|uniref:Myb/SANT-like domain-containing protein n=1 Tax=Dipteronia sinensis TaxID=43782 RepID=A0AAE0DU25_9ROSI|nr:hypothetical protein Dsin_027895 [Dipteronia sinensis]
MTQIEKTLTTMLLDYGLRANSHIDSKMRLWEKQYDIVYDMLNVSGFGWNDIKKCVGVDSNDVWEVYVHMLTANIFNKNEDKSDIADELATMRVDLDKELGALTLILDKPSNISAFMSLKGECRLAFVEKLL